MNYATVAANGLTSTLSETLVTQDFDKIRVGCP